MNVTVNISPAAGVISGLTAVCVGSTITLNDFTASGGTGTWSSSNPGIGTIGSASGVVGGMAVGTTTITFTETSVFCGSVITTTNITVNVSPIAGTINGAASVCAGSCITLSNTTASGGTGTWSSSNTAVGTVNASTGVVCGITPGTTMITYTETSASCGTAITTMNVTVNISPAAGVISGLTAVCVGSTITLNDFTASGGTGTWSSSNPGIGTIGSATGIVGGIAAGTTTISYTETSAFCGSAITTTNITVNVAPVAGTINGPSSVCVGLCISLSDVTASGGTGTWSSGNPAVGTVNATTGVVCGVGAGTTTITFTESNISCGSAITTMNVTVNANPTPITGITNVCVGLTTTLNSTPAGGTWGSSNVIDATVGSSSGIVTGLVPSTTTVITYTLGTGCLTTTTVTVNPNPTTITGSLNVCVGLSTTLNSTPAGGTWSSISANVNVGTLSGIITGLLPGTATIDYTLPTGCLITTIVTVNPNPTTITGSLTFCVGLSTTLNSTPAGGTWSSTSGNVNVGSSSGVITGLLPGTATIDYTLSTGCLIATIVTVNPLPSVIAGTLNVCVGATTALTDAGGGTWSTTSINVLVGTTGVVTGEFAGTAIITYTLPTTCITTAIVTVNPLPAAITGTMNVCAGLTTTLSDATTPGTWTSGTTTVATVGSSTGIVTGGVSVIGTAATDIITYTLPTGCYATAVVTVNPLPTAIGGIKTVCVNYTTTLTDASPGGTWSSSNPPVGSIGSNTGIVTGIATGTTTITYTLPTGCIITTVVTVNPLPGTITGTLTVCPGLTTTLTDVPVGGTWLASVGTGSVSVTTTGGVVTGGTAGTATVTYTIGTGCYVTTTVTVNPLPAAILGTPASVCSGLTVSLSDITAGGVWSSSASGIASVVGGTTGTVTGGVVGSASTATITYTLPATGCYVTAVVTVNPLPTPILGTLTVCSGLTTSLSDAGGGTWSTTSGIVTVNTITGLVTGGSVPVADTATIIYKLPTTCMITAIVTVNPLPTAILGNLSVCAGLTTTLSDAGGGTWTSGNLSVATIGLNTGIVTGVSAGTAIITYTLITGCITTAIVTVNPLPGAILGNLAVCQGLTTHLSDATTPGTWSTISPAIASVSTGGVVTGNIIASVPDTTTVIYTLPTTCIATAVITVNPLPATIMGATNVCSGLTITLSDATAGGTWLSSGSATVGGATGYVTGSAVGTSGGTATITYELIATGCLTTTVISVDPLPAAITGTMNVCSGLTTTLNDVTPSGTWSSSAVGIASVGLNSGIVTGESVTVTSLAIITYTIPSGCISTAIVTVNPLPVAISGIKQVCYGLTTDLSDASAGGTWSSNNTNAGIGLNTGVVTGNNVGTSIITYTLPTGCIMTTVVTVNPLPAGITGTLNVCVGFTTLLSDASAGGTWSSSVTAIGTVGSVSGIVGGIAPGTTKIIYTLPTGCITSVTVTVNPQPAPITGPTSVCHGLTIDLSDLTPGGVWSSSFPTIGSVGSTGVVTGTGVGNTTITYSLAAGCISTHVVTVNPLPAIFNVSGGGTYCEGGAGVPIYLSGSNVGISYLLFYDTSHSATGYLAGTGSPLNFGLLTVAGTYTVLATNNTTGCISDMLGSAFVIITPTVTPTVGISVTPGETVCPGTTVTLTPLPFYGGPSPTYVWSVNGVVVSLANSYTYIPANGDVVSVKMTSDSACASPLTATGKIVMNVIPDAAPLVSIAIDPGDTTCQYAVATFTATPTYGGTTPLYIWYVNGVVAGSGPMFSYYPSTGDVVYCKMVSNYQCRTSDTGFSNVAVMTVSPMIVPHVTIASTQGFNISVGEYDTLVATATNAGPHPAYQWELNGAPIPGATSSTYISQFNNYDSITCVVTSSGVCDGISTFDWIYISVYPEGVQQYTFGNGDIRLMPNPNTGTFTIKGTLGVLVDEEVTFEVTDMIGQTVYSRKVMVQNGKLNEQIQLGSKLANGMYLLNLRSGSDNKVFHFVIEQ